MCLVIIKPNIIASLPLPLKSVIFNSRPKCLQIPMSLGRRQANLCFHYAGSGENLPDIAKLRDASMGNEAEQLPV